MEKEQSLENKYKWNLKNTVKVYDNGGETYDRYTVLIDRDIYGMSEDPASTQGFNQYSGELGKGWKVKDLTKQFGKKVKFEKLPEQVKRAILVRLDDRFRSM